MQKEELHSGDIQSHFYGASECEPLFGRASLSVLRIKGKKVWLFIVSFFPFLRHKSPVQAALIFQRREKKVASADTLSGYAVQ